MGRKGDHRGETPERNACVSRRFTISPDIRDTSRERTFRGAYGACARSGIARRASTFGACRLRSFVTRDPSAAWRFIVVTVLLLWKLAAPTISPAFSVSVCAPEFPYLCCDPITTSRIGVRLFGPVPEQSEFRGELTESGFYWRFEGVAPGNYIAVTGGCTPFGCLIDTPVSVVDRDVVVCLQMVPPLSETVRPTPTPTPTLRCRCDADGSGRVRANEVLLCVHEAFRDCPP
ncbi:MAG: hypothetical protein KatS3mg076_2677 [Candidatus Binatia bacterium]|nr:MAG: hypothetical protein KatS3mg076_2677 [Candidatus Binatia bacterium]